MELNFYTSSGYGEEYLTVLTNIHQSLLLSEHIAQSKFIENLIDSLKNKHVDIFVKSINSVDMWGGSGAVWEVYISNELEQKRFEGEILSLIKLMRLTGIMARGIKPIEKIFERNSKMFG